MTSNQPCPQDVEFRIGDSTQLRRELIQVAAVAVAWVEAIDRAEKAKEATR